MIAATALKAIVFLHTYISLALVETFFIDWERPHLASIISANPTTGGLNENRSYEPTNLELSAVEFQENEPNKNLSKKSQYNPIVIW